MRREGEKEGEGRKGGRDTLIAAGSDRLPATLGDQSFYDFTFLKLCHGKTHFIKEKEKKRR